MAEVDETGLSGWLDEHLSADPDTRPIEEFEEKFRGHVADDLGHLQAIRDQLEQLSPGQDPKKLALLLRLLEQADDEKVAADIPRPKCWVRGVVRRPLHLTREWAGFNPRAVRDVPLQNSALDEQKIMRLLERPLDVRWAYVETSSELWNRARPDPCLSCPCRGPVPARPAHSSSR